MSKSLSIVVSLNGQGNLAAVIKEADSSLRHLGATGKQAGDGINAGVSTARAGVQSISAQLQRLKTEFIALASAGALVGLVKQFVDTADAVNNLNARLKLATKSTQEYAAAKEGVTAIALKTGQSLEAVGGLYSKVADAMRQMGKSQHETLTFTEATAQAMRLSGASASAAEASIVQLSQALSSGVLRGDEFNSIMEQSPRLAQAMADGLGVPKGALRTLAEEGKLTADIVTNAILSQKDALSGEFAQLPLTVAQSFQNLRSAMSLWVEKVDASNGVTAKLSASLGWLAKNFDQVARSVTTLASILLGGLVLRSIPMLIAGLKTVQASLFAVMLEMRTLQGATLSGAIAQIGKLKAVSIGLFAAWAGWEFGTWARETFESVRLAGVAMAAGIHKALAFLTGASRQEIQAIDDGYAEVFQQSTDKAQQASAAAVAATEARVAKTKAQLEQEKAAYAALNESIKAQYTERLAFIDAALQQQTALIAATQPNETAREAATTAAIIAAHAARLAAMQAYQAQALGLIEQEKSARLTAMSASGETEKQINLDVANARRAVLAGLLGDYQQHFSNLNAQYTAHLAHVQQIEEAKRQAVAGVEATLRDLARETMTARQAYYDKQKEIDELQAASRKALEEGNFKLAQEYAEKSVSLAKSTAQAVTEGDKTIVDKRQAVTTATDQVKQSLELMKQAYDGQSEAAKNEAAGTLAAMNETKSATENLKIAITALDAALQAQHSLTVKTNIPEVKSELNSLNGQNTSSTHTVYVKKVEQNATGGLVGAGVSAFATGGHVQKFAKGGAVFKRPSWRKVPGTGNGDTVPAALQAGSFVIKKSASQYYGDGLLGKIAGGVQKFATGGSVSFGGKNPLGIGYKGSDSDSGNGDDSALKKLREKVSGMIAVAKSLGYHDFARNMSTRLANTGTLEGVKAVAEYVRRALVNGYMAKMVKLTPGSGASASMAAKVDEYYTMKFAAGGMAQGSDTVPAMLTPGEWVVKKEAVGKYGLDLMHAINTMSIPKAVLERMASPPSVARFATGGLVGGKSATSSSPTATTGKSISLTVNAPSGDADAIARTLLPALNRIQGRSR